MDKIKIGDLGDLFDKIYSQFILRDVFAKIIPGFMLLATLVGCLTSSSKMWNFINSISLFEAILAFGVSWIVGFAIQGLGESLGKKWGLFLYFPKDIEYSEWLKMFVEFDKRSSLIEKQQRERLVVIKEACGNAYVSLSACSFLVIITNIVTMKCFFLSHILEGMIRNVEIITPHTVFEILFCSEDMANSACFTGNCRGCLLSI